MKTDIFKTLRIHFVQTCVATVSILLVVLFSMLWFINFQRTNRAVFTALETVLELHNYNITIPETPPSREDTLEESRSFIYRSILFTVSKDGKIDYQTLYEDHPYLLEFDDIVSVVEKTKRYADEGVNQFKLNGRYYKIDTRVHGEHTDYVFFDFTTERASSFNSASWFIVAFIFAIMAVGLLAYVLSDKVLDPVKKSMEKGRTLISNASHELKTPLTIISANLSVIQSEADSTVRENEKWFQTIEEQIKRTNTLIIDMLELSKLEDNGLPLNSNVDLTALTQSAILAVEALCFEKAITLEENIEENIAIKGDKPSLERLMLILIDNAIKYTPYAGNIVVTLAHTNKKNIVLSVKNSGEGIKKEDLPFVFERFYKGDRARTQETNAKSFGLGLAIAKSIAELHHGKIECNSEPNRYTEFKVTFKVKG